MVECKIVIVPKKKEEKKEHTKKKPAAEKKETEESKEVAPVLDTRVFSEKDCRDAIELARSFEYD